MSDERYYALVQVSYGNEVILEAELEPAQTAERDGVRVQVLWIRRHFDASTSPESVTSE